MAILLRSFRSLVIKTPINPSMAFRSSTYNGETKNRALTDVRHYWSGIRLRLNDITGETKNRSLTDMHHYWSGIRLNDITGLRSNSSKCFAHFSRKHMEFKKCRLLFQNVWNRKLTPVQSRILRRLKGKNRALLRNVSARRNLNSYIQLQTTRKLALFYANRFVHNRKEATIPFLLHLERRLDVILVRARFCDTLPQARQLISHRKVSVNNRIVKQSSFRVSPGDHINLKEPLLSRKRRIQRLLTVQLKKKVSQRCHGRRFRDSRKQRELLSKLVYMQKVLLDARSG